MEGCPKAFHGIPKGAGFIARTCSGGGSEKSRNAISITGSEQWPRVRWWDIRFGGFIVEMVGHNWFIISGKVALTHILGRQTSKRECAARPYCMPGLTRLCKKDSTFDLSPLAHCLSAEL